MTPYSATMTEAILRMMEVTAKVLRSEKINWKEEMKETLESLQLRLSWSKDEPESKEGILILKAWVPKVMSSPNLEVFLGKIEKERARQNAL